VPCFIFHLNLTRPTTTPWSFAQGDPHLFFVCFSKIVFSYPDRAHQGYLVSSIMNTLEFSNYVLACSSFSIHALSTNFGWVLDFLDNRSFLSFKHFRIRESMGSAFGENTHKTFRNRSNGRFQFIQTPQIPTGSHERPPTPSSCCPHAGSH